MILITEFMDNAAVERLSAAHTTTYAPDLADRQGELADMMPGVRALIVRNRTRVTRKLLDASPDLKVVGRLGVGLDNIDLDACKSHQVEVIPATGANTLAVAEYVVTSAAILLRRAYQANAAMLAGEWPRAACSGDELAGVELGLIGYGAIAREAARLARGMGMKIAAYDPLLPLDGPLWQGTTPKAFEELLATSDVVSLHVPLTETTHHLIDAKALATMQPNAVLINAARGGVVDEPALAAALRDGQISGAALDVFETEPLSAEAARKFQNLDNLILTPHIAGVTRQSNIRVSAMIADHVLNRLS